MLDAPCLLIENSKPFLPSVFNGWWVPQAQDWAEVMSEPCWTARNIPSAQTDAVYRLAQEKEQVVWAQTAASLCQMLPTLTASPLMAIFG